MQFVPRLVTLRHSPRPTIPVEQCGDIQEKKAKNRHPLVVQYTDPSKLLLLIHSFGFHSLSGIEKKLNRYFMKELSADDAFLVTFLRQEAQVRSVGNRKLKYLLRFKLRTDVIETLRNKCKTSTVERIGNLHITIQNIFKEILKEKYHGDIISVPIMTTNDSDIRVILYTFINPLKGSVFTVNCVTETFRFCLHILLNSIVYDVEKRKRELQDMLLDLLSSQYASFGHINDVLLHVLNNSVVYTNSAAGILYITCQSFRNHVVAKVHCTTKPMKTFVNLTLDKGAAGKVARTGKIINLKTAAQCKNEHMIPDLKVKSTLCFPIFYKKKLLVIVQLFNKHGSYYTLDDEELVAQCAGHCDIILNKWIQYNISMKRYTQNQMARMMLTNYIKFDDEAIEQMMHCEHEIYPGFNSFDFEPRSMLLADTSTWTLKMFENLDLLQKLDIDRKEFAKFILHVKFGYLDLPYHNWMLAFSMLHFTYLLFYNLKFIDRFILSDHEAFAIMLSVMGHFLDFRGHPNVMMLQCGLPLENMYSSEGHIMGSHHFSQLVHMMNLEQCSIFKRFPNRSYVKVITLVQGTMLKRDLNFDLIEAELLAKPDFSVYFDRVISANVKTMLITMVIGVSMLSDFFKNFKSSLFAFRQIYQEIEDTNDYEILPHNSSTLVKQQSLFYIQWQFSSKVIKPLLNAMEVLLPDLPDLKENMKEIARQWRAAKSLFEYYDAEGRTSLEMVRSCNFENRMLSLMSTNADSLSPFDSYELEEETEANLAEGGAMPADSLLAALEMRESVESLSL